VPNQQFGARFVAEWMHGKVEEEAASSAGSPAVTTRTQESAALARRCAANPWRGTLAFRVQVSSRGAWFRGPRLMAAHPLLRVSVGPRKSPTASLGRVPAVYRALRSLARHVATFGHNLGYRTLACRWLRQAVSRETGTPDSDRVGCP
jgi:hypothetical protein